MVKRYVSETFRSEDGQVWGYLLKIAIVFAFLIVLLTQVVPIIVNQVSIQATANQAAVEAVKTLQTQRNSDPTNLARAVQEYLDDKGAKLAGPIEVTETEIRVPVKKIRETFFFSRVSFLCKYVEADAIGVDTR